MSFADIELEYALGNHDKARQLLRRFLRRNPNSIEGWQLAQDLATDDATREWADNGLRKARAAAGEESIWGNNWDDAPPPAEARPAPTSQPAPASGSGGSFAMGGGSSTLSTGTDYRPYAIGVVVATFFFPFLGPVLAFIFLTMANNAESSGQTVQNKGCLTQALIGSVVVAGVSVLFTCVAFIIPLLAEF